MDHHQNRQHARAPTRPKRPTGTRRGSVGRAWAQQRAVPEGRARVQGLPRSANGVAARRRGLACRSGECCSVLFCSALFPVHMDWSQHCGYSVGRSARLVSSRFVGWVTLYHVGLRLFYFSFFLTRWYSFSRDLKAHDVLCRHSLPTTLLHLRSQAIDTVVGFFPRQ